MRDWAVRPVGAGCNPRAALSLIDSKTLYSGMGIAVAVVSGILAEEEEFRELVRGLP